MVTQPDAPINVVEIVSIRTSTSITLSWSQGLSNGGLSVLDYTISYVMNNNIVIVAQNITQT